MKNNSLVLKGLTGSVILIGATLVALPGAAADSDTEMYGVTQSNLEDNDFASSLLAEDSENQIGVAAAPQTTTAVKPKNQDEDEFEVLDLHTEETHNLEVTESAEAEDYIIDFTDLDGEEAVYLTVREDGEIIHDEAFEEGEELDLDDLNAEVEDINHEEETLQVKTTVSNGYVIRGGPSVNELMDKLEKVNPRMDTSRLKKGNYNALIVTGDNTEEAVKNLASLQEGVERSEIDINTG